MLRDATDYAAGHRAPVAAALRLSPSVLSSELSVVYPDVPLKRLVQFLDEMQAALIGPNTHSIEDLLNRMRREGIRDTDIADFYVPVVARRLGEGWAEDRLEFNRVTVGIANLQAMLRGLDASWDMPEREPFGTLGTMCIIVPAGAQHTLGATILAGQMRRAGYDVRFGLGLGLSEISEFVAAPSTVAIMVSASLHEPLAFLRRVVEKARAGNRWVPILIGGNVLDQDCDVCAQIGADHATSDWETAMSYCSVGLTL